MLHKEFKGLRLSALGMGTVRLPLLSEKSLCEIVLHFYY